MPPELVVDRFRRTLAILLAYDNGEPPPVTEVLERFRIDRQQLARDVAACDGAGLPPYLYSTEVLMMFIDEDDDTLAVDAPWAFTERGHLSAGEGLAVLTAAATLLMLEPNDPVLASAVSKLRKRLGVEADVAVDLDRPPALAPMLAASRDALVVAGRYWSAYRDEVGDRILEPHLVFYGSGAWYARCLDRGDGMLKLFRVDRFEQVQATEEHFPPGTVADDTEVFHPGPDATRVTLWFPPAAAWVQDDLDIEVTSKADDGFTGTLSVVGTSWLANLVLRTGARILDPPALLGVGSKAAERALAQYQQ